MKCYVCVKCGSSRWSGCSIAWFIDLGTSPDTKWGIWEWCWWWNVCKIIMDMCKKCRRIVRLYMNCMGPWRAAAIPKLWRYFSMLSREIFALKNQIGRRRLWCIWFSVWLLYRHRKYSFWKRPAAEISIYSTFWNCFWLNEDKVNDTDDIF